MSKRSNLQTYIALSLLGAGLLLAFLLFQNQLSDLVDKIQGQPPGKEVIIRVEAPPQDKEQKDSKGSTSTNDSKGTSQQPSDEPSGTTPQSPPTSPESPTSSPPGTDGGPPTGGTDGDDGGGNDPGSGGGNEPPQDDDGDLGPVCTLAPSVCDLLPKTEVEVGPINVP